MEEGVPYTEARGMCWLGVGRGRSWEGKEVGKLLGHGFFVFSEAVMAGQCILSAGRRLPAHPSASSPHTTSLTHTHCFPPHTQGRGQERKFCSDSFLSSRQLATMMELKTQFRRMLRCELPHFGEGELRRNKQEGRRGRPGGKGKAKGPLPEEPQQYKFRLLMQAPG